MKTALWIFSFCGCLFGAELRLGRLTHFGGAERYLVECKGKKVPECELRFSRNGFELARASLSKKKLDAIVGRFRKLSSRLREPKEKEASAVFEWELAGKKRQVAAHDLWLEPLLGLESELAGYRFGWAK